MMITKTIFSSLLLSVLLSACSKNTSTQTPLPVTPDAIKITSTEVNGVAVATTTYNIKGTPVIKFSFTGPVSRSSASNSFTLKENSGSAVAFNLTYENNDNTVVIQPASALKPITQYVAAVLPSLLSANGGALVSATAVKVITAVDPSNKFPVVADNELLDIVQRQTFKYFWEFGHPNSGLARERNTSGDVVTSGGSGFGVMAIVTAIHRNFISRAEGLARMQKIVGFLTTKADRFHGAFPHWMDGNTGKVVPFSPKDNGADLVETSFLMQGLLTARQYFDGAGNEEKLLRDDINSLWKSVEWNWFTRNNEKVLFWHWSPNYNWDINQPVKGWNEALITYALAASSPNYAISKDVYDQGWAGSGSFKNGNSYYGIPLPLGPDKGGPLFFAHYSFLGINPNSLSDASANYATQNKAHTLINYNYCLQNPKGYFGYSDSCWGLTASDDFINGYLAHEPNNDDGVITPSAALSSMPYAPAESMKALKYFYYRLGDKLFKTYGFVDAFSLNDTWFADSYLAIDQGPIIVMIENYRSGLLWKLFMSCPELKAGMHNLGFTSPNL